MQLDANYPTISLDSIANAATYFSGKWNPELKRNQSQQLLTLILDKLYWPTRANIFRGNPFHARIQASHAALGETLELSRVWICKLTRKLRDAKWIETYAPRKPNGKYQEVTIYRPGKKLKKLLVMLLKSHQRPENHISTTVNGQQQKVPTKEEREENKARFAQLIAEVGKNKDLKKAIKW